MKATKATTIRKKNLLKAADAAAVRKAVGILRRLAKKARAWQDRLDAMPKAEWRGEIAKFSEWAARAEKETGAVLAFGDFRIH